MNECVRKFVNELEPLIADLDDKLMELRTKKEKHEDVSRLLAYVNGDVNLVGVYADQELILDNLDKINSNKDEYKASCYLLRGEDASVKSLPQYKNAVDYILKLIDYFKVSKNQLAGEIQSLEMVCNEKELEKKYFELLSTESPEIQDVLEFEEFLNKHVINDEEKIDLLIYTIKSNVLNYRAKKI